MDTTLRQSIEEYGNSIIKKEYKKIVSSIYPKLFDFIPIKTLENSLKTVYANSEIDIAISNYHLKSIDYNVTLDNIQYCIVSIAFRQNIKYNLIEDESESISSHYDVLKTMYGEKNVQCEIENKEITADSFSKQLAIKENNTWRFLDLKAPVIELYSTFLPQVIIHQLESLFPPEIEDKLVTSEEYIEKEKLNIVSKANINKNIQVIYLLGWEVLLNGDEQCQNFIATQITNFETFEHAHTGLELIFENKKLSRVNEYYQGNKTEKELKTEEIGLPYQKYQENKILNITESLFGLHQLGGEIPKGFQLPENNCIVPFQYLGFIDNQDENFQWLPFRVHMTCPIYLNFDHIFLDYTKPHQPVILNRKEVEKADTSYGDDLSQNSEIVFNEMKFSFMEDNSFAQTGHSGIPNWIQYPDIPTCPKSGKRMKLLCQLNGGVSAKRSNVKAQNELDNQYYEELNFWGDGDLFVFFEPTSKVACYFIQNT